MATAIAKGLNETHATAMAAKARHAQAFTAEIRELEAKEDRLFERYDAGEIDRETYDRQLRKVREQKRDREQKLHDANTHEDAKYLMTAERVLELASRRDHCGKAVSLPTSVICSNAWFVTRASMVEPCVST